jgi:hypothetical protein
MTTANTSSREADTNIIAVAYDVQSINRELEVDFQKRKYCVPQKRNCQKFEIGDSVQCKGVS